MKKNLLKISLLITSLILTTQVSFSQHQNSTQKSEAEFSTYPTYFHGNNSQWIIQTLKPGQNYTDYFTIENLTNNFQSYQIDFRETTGSEKNIQIIENTKSNSESQNNIINWQKIPYSKITLGPKEKKSIQIYFQIPQEIQNGKHQGVILVSNSKIANNTDTIINTRIGNRVYLDIDSDSSFTTQNTIFPYKINFLQLNLIILSMFGIFFSILLNRKTPLKQNA